MKPFILNLDSTLDWTAEVGQLWRDIDWVSLRSLVASGVGLSDWMERRGQLGLIGLVSNLTIEHAYHWRGFEERRRDEDDEPWNRDWRDRQLGRNRDNERSNEPRERPPLTGEEPFLRGPRVGGQGVIECYGIYVSNAHAFLVEHGFADKVPEEVRDAPAVFLCPEFIYELYPQLLRAARDLRAPLPLRANPALSSLKLTLIHELGHHFFPLHENSQAGPFLSEGFANRFCYHAIEPDEQVWLLYKSWHLQPPEYSAYRPLNVLCEADADCSAAADQGFSGSLDAWHSLPKKEAWALHRLLGASTHMALAADTAPCAGLYRELQPVLSEDNKYFLVDWEPHGMIHHHVYGGSIPADLVRDLYDCRDVTPWITVPGLPSHFWSGWGIGDSVNWPSDCLAIPADDADTWIAVFAQADNWALAELAQHNLTALKDNPAVAGYLTGILANPDCCPPNRSRFATLSLDGKWMVGMTDKSSVAVGEGWIAVVAEHICTTVSTNREGFTESGLGDAVSVLKLIPRIQLPAALRGALDRAASVAQDEGAGWNLRQRSCWIIAICEDRASIAALEAAAAATCGGDAEDAVRVRRAADEALKRLLDVRS